MSKVWWQEDRDLIDNSRRKMNSLLTEVVAYFGETSRVRSRLIEGSYQIRPGVSISWSKEGLQYGLDGDMIPVRSANELTGRQLVDISCYLGHLAAHIQSLKEVDEINCAILNTESFLNDLPNGLCPAVKGGA
jgi:hypothetical protein